MDDVECPYCEKMQEINHDDGYGYEEDRAHEQDCEFCGKTFVYNTCIYFTYSAFKAPCKNGGPINLSPCMATQPDTSKTNTGVCIVTRKSLLTHN